MDSFINFAYAFGGVLGGWLITYFYYRKTKKDTHKQIIKDKMEKLLENINFAYKKKNNDKRKESLRDIIYINVRDSRDLLGNQLVMDIEDLLFKNLDNKDEVLVEVKKSFKKHHSKYFA